MPDQPNFDELTPAGGMSYGDRVKDQEGRLRSVEKCSRDTLELARSTSTAVENTQKSIDKLDKKIGKGIGLGFTLLLFVLGSGGGFIMRTNSTNDEVVRIQADVLKGEADRVKLHESIHNVRDTVHGVKRDVASDRQADDRVHMSTSERLDDIEAAPMGRRR